MNTVSNRNIGVVPIQGIDDLNSEILGNYNQAWKKFGNRYEK